MSYAQIFAKAQAAAFEAFNAAQPNPMVVAEADVFGRPIAGGQRWVCNDGVCGFAWIKIRPARGKFVSWCKDNRIGRKDSYEGGFNISSNVFGGEIAASQSYERKMNAMRAAAQVLREELGIQNIYADGRLD